MKINKSESAPELPSPLPHPLGGEVDEELNDYHLLKSIYDAVEASIFVVDVLADGNFRYAWLNPTYERWTGIRLEDLRGKTPEEILSKEDAASVRQHFTNCVRFGRKITYEECLQFQGIAAWWITTLAPVRDGNSRIFRLIGTSTNITIAKQTEEVLRQQAQREQILGAIAQRIRQSLDLQTILNRTVTEVRQFLATDRVLIYRFCEDWSGDIVVESVISTWISVLGTNIRDPCFDEKHVERYRRGHIQVVEDVYNAGLHPCHIDFLASFQVKANLVVPIVSENKLWGLLIAQHCQQPRQWYQTEIDLLKQLASQVGIAVEQAELHQVVQHLNLHLEAVVEQRTAELQQALDFEALVRYITEKIRDSLDVTQVLQTATQELARLLKVEQCKIELYSSCRTSATFAYEYSENTPVCQGLTRIVADYPEIYEPLLQKQSLQFGEIEPRWNPNSPLVTRLAYPIFDDRGIIGNLWLIRSKELAFDEFETRLVEQVANECAIAIRQARLYEASQAQVRELEKLEHLKNDFLKTLSHELRTPITSIQLAAETLEFIITQPGALNQELSQITPLFQILHEECQREGKLINDLLSLTYLDAETKPLILETIYLEDWIPAIVEPFRERIDSQQQQLKLTVPLDIPPFETDIGDLERILIELLSNACKYTPKGESIAISAAATQNQLFISVSNSGVEISSDQIPLIFDPFYRIPNNDPWKHGGTGLGLALVKKLVKHLGATITVDSGDNNTTFTVELPIRADEREIT